jgi:segregation and condensation protein B
MSKKRVNKKSEEEIESAAEPSAEAPATYKLNLSLNADAEAFLRDDEEPSDEQGDDLGDDLGGELAWEEDPVKEETELQEGPEFSAAGTELEEFKSASIEVEELLSEEKIASIIESLLFATDRPQSIALLKGAFKGTNVRSHHIRAALEKLKIDYSNPARGVALDEIAGGYQLRTKSDNMIFLRRTVKSRPFRLSGPALEVLAIVAYRQPVIKAQIDEIRGVESGHLLRALMEKSLVHFAGRSESPGKPMLYETSRRFLEVFSLRNLGELPSLSEVDQLIPEGIGDDEPDKETLTDLSGTLAETVVAATYSEGEEELVRISEELAEVETTSAFFEQEKVRIREERDRNRAQDIREALVCGEEVSEADRRWLTRYEVAQSPVPAEEPITAPIVTPSTPEE